MSFFSLKRPRLTDEQYVDRARKQIDLLDKYRFWILLSRASLIGLYFWFFSKVMQVAMRFAQGQNVPIAVMGFSTGAILAQVPHLCPRRLLFYRLGGGIFPLYLAGNF